MILKRGMESYWKVYMSEGHATKGIYYKNKSATHSLYISHKFKLENCIIRHSEAVCADLQKDTLNLWLYPGED